MRNVGEDILGTGKDLSAAGFGQQFDLAEWAARCQVGQVGIQGQIEGEVGDGGASGAADGGL